MQYFKIVVIGLGSMGKRRVRNLLANGVLENNIVGVDLRDDRISEANKKYKIKVSSSLTQELIDFADAFVISTPPDQHLAYANLAAKNSIHMFIEASVLDEGLNKLANLVKEKKITAFPSCTMRFFDAPKRIKRVVEQGSIGKVLAWQYQSGQYLPDWHPWEPITDFYVSKYITGGCREIVPFELVWLEPIFGKIKNVEARHSKCSDMPAEIDDIYMLQMEHKNGVLGQLIVDVLGRCAVRHMRITGSLGTLEWDDESKIIKIFTVESNEWTEEKIGLGSVEAKYINPEEPYIEEMKTFLQCAKHNIEPEHTLSNDIDILHVLYSAENSNNDKKRTEI